MREEEEVAWGTSEGRRWHGNTTVVEMVKVDEKKKGWSKRLSRGRGERHWENKSNRRPTLKRWFSESDTRSWYQCTARIKSIRRQDTVPMFSVQPELNQFTAWIEIQELAVLDGLNQFDGELTDQDGNGPVKV
ncbi:hypothetical protein EMCRGX_G008530 [Ephydatia muelleri]